MVEHGMIQVKSYQHLKKKKRKKKLLLLHHDAKFIIEILKVMLRGKRTLMSQMMWMSSVNVTSKRMKEMV